VGRECTRQLAPVKMLGEANIVRRTKQISQMHLAVDLTADAIVALRESLTGADGKLKVDAAAAAAIASLVRSLDTGQERLRIHRGKPLPGSLRPSRATPHSASDTLT
jgi:SpoVK/Ycf46/Vps4 family AAA+-type ATPase